MKAAVIGESLVIAVGHDEACHILNGGSVGDRINPLHPDAKLVVRPLIDLDATSDIPTSFYSPEYFRRLRVARCIAYFYEDLDITVFVPREIIATTAIAAEQIPRNEIVAPLSTYPEQLLRSMPADGINMRFDNGICLPETERLQLRA